MQVKSIVELTIIDLTEEGAGVAKHDKQVFFVTGGIIGDYVQAQVTKIKKNYILARVIKIIEPSEHRIKPPCPYAYTCGGCSVQHLDYDEQLQLKERLVVDTLERIGGQKDYTLEPIIGMTFPYHYRNKALYPFGLKDKSIILGFYKPQTHDIVPIDACMIQHEDNKGILALVLKWANENKLTVYNEHTHTGLLRHLMIRTTNQGNHMIGLIVNGDSLPKIELLITALSEKYPSIKSIMFNKQTNKGNTILGNRYYTLYGSDTIHDSIGDLKFELAMPAFFQVNPQQTQALYQRAMDYADLKGHEIVWDIYSGAGTITLHLAKHAKYVYGNELVQAAVENAHSNAQLNGISNVDFISGLAEDVVPKWLKNNASPDVVVLDPPRKGAELPVLEAILTMQPERIVYVSCKPSTLARDVKILCQGGYRLERVTPVDMFPHSMHVEAIILMTRSGSGEKK